MTPIHGRPTEVVVRHFPWHWEGDHLIKGEMARHEALTQRLKIEVFFAYPHNPWQRLANEN